MSNLTDSQSLLLKASFLPEGEIYFKSWLEKYGKKDLDYHTRAIISLLLASIDIGKYDADLQNRMLWYKRQTWIINTRKFYQVKLILDEFSSEKIDCTFLKGVAMMLFYYNDVSQRLENADIDLMVPKSDLKKAISILRKNDFLPQNVHYWKGDDLEHQVLDEGKVLSALHAITYRKGNVIIDLHWRISPFIKLYDDNFFKNHRLVSNDKLKNQFFYFDCEMQLAHIAIHAAFNKHNSLSLNNMIDFCYLTNKKLDVNRLVLLKKEFQGFIGYVFREYQFYIDQNIYRQIDDVFISKLSFVSRFIPSMLFSKNYILKRLGQLISIFRVYRYNPVRCIKYVFIYFGVKNKEQYYALIKYKLLKFRKSNVNNCDAFLSKRR